LTGAAFDRYTYQRQIISDNEVVASMKLSLRGAAILPLLFLATQVFSQTAGFFPLEKVQAGQKGYGKTIFVGDRVEQFEFEVLGVLKNMGPKQDLILARLSGERLAHTGVFAGMSGSPVYIEDKLVGAVAYAFSFSKDPIAGITPIQQIVDIFKERPETTPIMIGKAHPQNLLDPSDQIAALLPPELRGFSKDQREAGTHALQQIATPLNLSGFSALAVDQFTPQLRALGLEPVRGIGGMAAQSPGGQAPGAGEEGLEPGSTVAVQLVRGDMDVSAVGTVTHVSGNQIYAFGHPFLSIGYTDLPLAKASVITVIPSLMNSMKVAATTHSIGTIRQDRATGVMGVTGEKARLIPVKLRLKTSRNENKEFNYEVVTDNFLTPFLMAFTVQNGIISSERAIGGQTLQIKCNIAVKGQPEIVFENSVSDLSSSTAFAAIAASAPVHFLLSSGFDDVVMERITIDISAVEQTRQAVVEKVWQDKLEARPGEEVNLTVFLRKPNGDVKVEKYPITVPKDISPGVLKLMIGDGSSMERSDVAASQGFTPTSLRQLIKAINNLKKNNRLYVRLYRDQAGAVIDGEPLPDLPPSLLTLYRSQKTAGEVKTINQVIYIEHELPATDSVLSGQKIIRINVKS
jgi:hypothetical protein